MNFWVYDLLVENATPPPGGGAKKQVGEVQARSGGGGADSRALSRPGVFLLLSPFHLGGVFICLHKERNEVSKVAKEVRYGGAAYLWLQVAPLASSVLLWSRKLEVLLGYAILASKFVAKFLIQARPGVRAFQVGKVPGTSRPLAGNFVKRGVVKGNDVAQSQFG